MSKHEDEAWAIARCVRGCATDDQYIDLMEHISAALAARDAEIERLTAERDRWQQDSMRQAATINRLSAATEDRNEVDILRHKAHEAEMTLLRAQVERMRETVRQALLDVPSEYVIEDETGCARWKRKANTWDYVRAADAALGALAATAKEPHS